MSIPKQSRVTQMKVLLALTILTAGYQMPTENAVAANQASEKIEFDKNRLNREATALLPALEAWENGENTKKVGQLVMELAQKGNSSAQVVLARYYIVYGGENPMIGPRLAATNTAMQHLRPAIAAGNPDALALEAYVYFLQKGSGKDTVAEAAWLKKLRATAEADSAFGNYLVARQFLGDLFNHPGASGQDIAQAVEYLQKAAILGDPRSQYALGRLYSRDYHFPNLNNADRECKARLWDGIAKSRGYIPMNDVGLDGRGYEFQTQNYSPVQVLSNSPCRKMFDEWNAVPKSITYRMQALLFSRGPKEAYSQVERALGKSEKSSASFITGKNDAPGKLQVESCSRPEYPKASKRNEETGTVTLSFRVSADGSASEGKLVKSSGFRNLDRAALAALSLCKWTPRMTAGKPVESIETVSHAWSLP